MGKMEDVFSHPVCNFEIKRNAHRVIIALKKPACEFKIAMSGKKFRSLLK